jgi:hypothetical protein
MKMRWTLASQVTSVVAQSESRLIATTNLDGVIQLWREDFPNAIASLLQVPNSSEGETSVGNRSPFQEVGSGFT